MRTFGLTTETQQYDPLSVL